MQTHQPTRPFGRRSLTLAHVAAQVVTSRRPPDRVVHKWTVFRAIWLARPRLAVSERALSVLNALLSSYPETTLSGDDPIVFPSTEQLSLRAHGMPASTLRRHLAGLVDAGLVVGCDSPNGKRYARKGRGGELQFAFGFDLSPLVTPADKFEALAAEIEAEARAVVNLSPGVARAEEFEPRAEDVLAEERTLRLVRERITLCRRGIAKMIVTGVERGVPTRRVGEEPFDWSEIHGIYRGILEGVCTRGPLSVDGEIGMPTKRELSPLQLRHVLRLRPRWANRATSWCATFDDPGESEIGGSGRAGYESTHHTPRPRGPPPRLPVVRAAMRLVVRAEGRLHCDVRESSRRPTRKPT